MSLSFTTTVKFVFNVLKKCKTSIAFGIHGVGGWRFCRTHKIIKWEFNFGCNFEPKGLNYIRIWTLIVFSIYFLTIYTLWDTFLKPDQPKWTPKLCAPVSFCFLQFSSLTYISLSDYILQESLFSKPIVLVANWVSVVKKVCRFETRLYPLLFAGTIYFVLYRLTLLFRMLLLCTR